MLVATEVEVVALLLVVTDRDPDPHDDSMSLPVLTISRFMYGSGEVAAPSFFLITQVYLITQVFPSSFCACLWSSPVSSFRLLFICPFKAAVSLNLF